MAAPTDPTRRLLPILILLVVGLSFLMSQASFMKRYELFTYNFLIGFSEPVTQVDPRLRVLAIDDASLGFLGQWPWPRGRHGEMLDSLRKGGAAAAMLDILFLEPARDPMQDMLLSSSLKQFGKGTVGCLAGVESEFDKGQVALPIPDIAAAAAGVGFVDARRDEDGVLRRVRLVRPVDGKWLPSLDLATFALINGVKPADIVYGASEIRVGSQTIRTDGEYGMLIPYFSSGTASGPVVRMLMTPKSYACTVTPPAGKEVPPSLKHLTPDEIRGGVFLVGPTAEGLTREDRHETPMGDMAGIMIHANILNGLLTGARIVAAPDWAYLLCLILFPPLLAWPLSRMRALPGLAVALAVLAIYTVIVAYAFSHGLWIKWVAPAVAIVLATVAVEGFHFVRSHYLLGRFVAPEVADALLARGGSLESMTHEKEVTVVFSDIRGYTTLSETMAPSEMTALLNEYHSHTVPLYQKHGGRCLDYLGDAQMVVFGDPYHAEDHAAAAVRAACDVQDAIADLNRQRETEGRAPFDVGIGLCTGLVSIGTVFAADGHAQYTAIGDPTNTAARVQGLSRDLDSKVLAAESTVKSAGDAIEVEPLKEVMLKGKAKPLMVYRVLGYRAAQGSLATRRLTVLAVAGLLAASLLSTACNRGTAPGATASPSASTNVSVAAPEGTPSPVVVPTPPPALQPPVPPAASTEDFIKPTSSASAKAAPSPVEVVEAVPPAPASKATAAKSPGFARMTLPIYPMAQKRADSRTTTQDDRGRNVGHEIIVVMTSDSMEQVKTWYVDHMKPSIVIDRGHAGDRVVTMTEAPAGRSDAVPPATIVLQRVGGQTQITMSAYHAVGGAGAKKATVTTVEPAKAPPAPAPPAPPTAPDAPPAPVPATEPTASPEQ